jgi:hypothetical protein
MRIFVFLASWTLLGAWEGTAHATVACGPSTEELMFIPNAVLHATTLEAGFVGFAASKRSPAWRNAALVIGGLNLMQSFFVFVFDLGTKATSCSEPQMPEPSYWTIVVEAPAIPLESALVLWAWLTGP